MKKEMVPLEGLFIGSCIYYWFVLWIAIESE